MDMSEWVIPQDEGDSPPNLPQCLLPILIYSHTNVSLLLGFCQGRA